jgi:hypothetical protein
LAYGSAGSFSAHGTTGIFQWVTSILEEKSRLTFTTIPDGSSLEGHKPWILRQTLLKLMVIEVRRGRLRFLR